MGTIPVVIVGSISACSAIWFAVFQILKLVENSRRAERILNELSRLDGRLDGRFGQLISAADRTDSKLDHLTAVQASMRDTLSTVYQTTNKTFFQASGLGGTIQRHVNQTMEPYKFYTRMQDSLIEMLKYHADAWRSGNHTGDLDAMFEIVDRLSDAQSHVDEFVTAQYQNRNNNGDGEAADVGVDESAEKKRE
jgi:hypothetical protein